METLQPEVLDNIKSFSGTPGEMNALQSALSEGKGIQKIQTAYTTAVSVQKPRSITRVTANVLEEAKLAGASFYYKWPVKNKKTGKTDVIQGPSIDLAMSAARNYGNCAIDIDEDETVSHFRFRGIFIDLESGFTCPRLFRQRKGQGIGMKDEERAEDIVYQIGQSKAIRNAVIRALPAWLIDQAIEVAMEAEVKKINPENISLARAKSFSFFQQYGISQERMESKIERKMDDWTAQDIADLRGMATALKEGRISANELFPTSEEEKQDEQKEKIKKKNKHQDEGKEQPAGGAEDAELAPDFCPNSPENRYTKEHCDACVSRQGCPVWPEK